MWVFLMTEVMFFGGIFTAYVVYRTFHAEGFAAASSQARGDARRDQHRGADL